MTEGAAPGGLKDGAEFTIKMDPPKPSVDQFADRVPDRHVDRGGDRGRERDRHMGPPPGGSGGGGGAAGTYSQSSRRNRRSRSTSRERERRDLRRKRRKERGSNFDVLPEGMSEATANQIAAQAFLQQTLPQASTSAAPMPAMSMVPLMPASATPSMQQTRHARRLYVGNIPPCTDAELQIFFEELLTRALGYNMEGSPVVSVYLNQERGFAFVELKSVALTTAAMQLDGVTFQDTQLKIRRPSDYNAAAVPQDVVADNMQLNLGALGIISNTVPDGPNKVFIGGLPYHLTEEQVKELLSAFGPLKAMHLVKDAGAVNSKGYGFCEYIDPAVTLLACEGLNGMNLGDKTLTVRMAMSSLESQNKAAASAMLPGLEQLQMLQAMAALEANPTVTEAAVAANAIHQMQPTRILVLLNMISEAELRDDKEYVEVKEDIEEECKQYGQIISVIIPREGPGEGQVFIEYASPLQAQAAGTSLAGRQFAARIVKAKYHPESKFLARDYS